MEKIKKHGRIGISIADLYIGFEGSPNAMRGEKREDLR